MHSTLASTGIFTPILQAVAAAIAAGAVVGGFVGTTNGARLGLTRRQVEAEGFRNTYLGAAWGVGLWLFDQCIVYASSV